MDTVAVTDHGFKSVDPERSVIESAGFELMEINPPCKTEDDMISRCSQADVLIVQFAPVTRRVLEALPKVKCIVRYGVGVNNFDLEAAADLGVTAANVPDFCLEEVSNHTIAMILSLVRRIPQDHAKILRGGWGILEFSPIPAPEELTLGLVGFGAIGRRTAEKAKVFGFRIVAFDPNVNASVFQDNGVEQVELDELLTKSDVISLHCPLLPATQHLINQRTIAMMKPGVIFVNTSRGGVVCEPDLIEAIASGHISGAGLDVFEEEPLPSGSELRNFPSVILTSHGASLSDHSLHLLQVKAAEAARDFLLGKRPATALV